MNKRILDLPEPLGNVISEAVLSVTQDPDEYELWYHDQPIWLVHRVRPAGRYTRVSRVQITPCVLDSQEVLLVQPDAQLLESTTESRGSPAQKAYSVNRSLSLASSAAGADWIDLAKLFGETSAGHLEWAKNTVADMILRAWDKAQALSDEDLDPVSPAPRAAPAN